MYGFQWRRSGAEYTDMHADYTDKGVDQLAAVIQEIKHNPTSRRIIMCAWNPKGQLTDLYRWDSIVLCLPPRFNMARAYMSHFQI